MKTYNIFPLLLLPASLAYLAGAFMYRFGSFSGLFSHDIYESHLQSGVIPFICVLSFFLVFLPCLFLLARVLFPAPVAVDQFIKVEEIKAVLATPCPSFEVGQVFSFEGCKVRVKALRNTMFASADLSEFDYALQFSF
jgi:hypothetical protein